MGRGFPNIEVSEEALFVESENLAAGQRMGQIGRLPVERSHTGCYGTGLFGREVVCQCMGQLGRLSIELSRTGGQSIGLFDQIGRLPVERSRTGCRIGRMLPGVLRCLGRLFRLFRNGRARCVFFVLFIGCRRRQRGGGRCDRISAIRPGCGGRGRLLHGG